MSSKKFPYELGEKFLRKDMHAIVGGSFRHGMTSCSNGEEFLLFHDKKKSIKYGYNVWEGLQADGSFHYTGQGTKGNQELTKSNLALIRANENANPIHLIESVDGECTYLGEFFLDNPPFVHKMAPDESKLSLRQVLVFRLLPLRLHEDISAGNSLITMDVKNWSELEYGDLRIDVPIANEKTIARPELKLQTDFGKYLLKNGHSIKILEFNFKDMRGILRPDFWIEDMNYIIEAKPSVSREYVRLAIGQVLDYINLGEMVGISASPAILLPGLPCHDLVQLIERHGIVLIYKSGDTFIFKTRD